VCIRKADREHFVVFDLDVRHRIIARRVVHIGTLSGVEVHPREVFRDAIVNASAAVILAHNHPSGDPTPSRQDLEITARLRQVGELLGITVLDHVIVADDGFVSLADRGWI
jgi:DNA repair protein RadC